MLTEILPHLHQIEVPLPGNPLKSVNCYVVTSDERSLLVDTGGMHEESEAVLHKGLLDVGVNMDRLDVLITHMHSDHIGLLPTVQTDDNTVYFNRPEVRILDAAREQGGFGQRMSRMTKQAGFCGVDLDNAFKLQPGLRYAPPDASTFSLVEQGTRIEVGEYSFECVETPGHSPGHICLHDAEKKLMLCGDHVLNQISPNIATWHEDDDPLTDYLASLEKAKSYDVELALPGHRTNIEDFAGRIDELISHHHERLDEVTDILADSKLNAHDIASRMKWNMRYDTWEDVRMIQRWFATGEAISHLRYLQREGRIESELQNEQLIFALA
jgi:glyoxylase-like metal-dependent hydrolase (beta-lactamase superfamily II)